MKKPPKSILKSPSLPTNQPSNASLQALTTDLVTGLPRKLTFAEKEVLETFPSENSGSDFSIDENSQNNTIINNDDNDYLTSSITYETPITTFENQTVQSSKDEEDVHSRRMKMEQSNTTATNDEYDDYELQEKLSSSPNNRPSDILKQQEEHNESAASQM